MNKSCQEFRDRHPCPAEADRAHEASCGECRSFAAAWELLREYPEIQASPRFLAGVRRRLAPAVLRYLAPLAAAAAALLLSLVVFHGPGPDRITEEERELVENLEILENFDLLRSFEVVDGNASSLLEDRR